MAKAKIILNEQHTLMEEQKHILTEKFGSNFEIIPVPANGWNVQEMNEVATKLENQTVVFASPIPYLMVKLALDAGNTTTTNVLVFHNDNRDKKELPNGKIIMVVSQTGWQLI